MLVVARKFNDIFYAISTDEWKLHKEHDLLLLPNNVNPKDFPMLDKFDNVFVINSIEGKFNIIYILLEIAKLFRKIKYECVTISNVALVTSLYILKVTKCRRTILLEDGLMNYYDFKSSQRFSKRLFEFMLGINEQRILRTIYCTYLLKPGDAIYYYGIRKRIQIDDSCIPLNRISELSGKKIFIGQNIYQACDMTVEEYSTIVNKIMSYYKIDYYIPHRNSVKEESICGCVFDINKTNLTLEVIAAYVNFELFSFSSTVLYSTKFINPQIITHAIIHERQNLSNEINYILNSVDEIIDAN